ncbi:ubiquitin-associated protein 1-like [Rhopalosiphum padi]|uniref:ubiquitin-associated protein 1-like n=1 Tax=Rhopalosiphum padi TaxID=40932 RepID=UPI00298DAA76|nr:ubiquitin-associated protein 1-like [Rhopalosiphum padi]XP_060834377.1 ubiquitin-associated protein 1-like [Rhopalosiphum padi]
MSYGGSSGQESDKNGFSYMDNIPVKIIEKYKPPKKIALPGVLQHKPTSNALKTQYDFNLEKNVLEKMAIWSKIREEAKTRRHLQAAEFKTQDYLDLDKLTLLNPAQQQNTKVLQPIPAQQMNLKMSSYDTMLTKNINISDFESDTSSPFDNMELKTINDLEELASVLKPTSVYNNTNIKNVQPSDINVSQYYPKPIYNNYSEHFNSNEFLHNPNIKNNQTISPIPKSNSNVIGDKNSVAALPPVTMPNILLQLEADLNTLKYNDESPNDPQKSLPHITTNGSKSPTCSFPNPYRSLSPTSQCLADQMHQMGFPLSRAARACKIFGKDESKVIEFLIQVHSIEETSGYTADRVEQALVVNNFNADHAITFLKNVDRLIDFGFREENICSALVKCNNDPDKALDSLVSY